MNRPPRLEPVGAVALAVAVLVGIARHWPTWLLVVLAWWSGAMFVFLVGAVARYAIQRTADQ